MEYVPALSLLIALVVLILAGIWRFAPGDLQNIVLNANFVLLTAAFLFCVVGVIHLFDPQAWTSDILKVLVGVLVGAATASHQSHVEGGTVQARDITDSAVAARDLFQQTIDRAETMDQTIENMQGRISSLKSEVSQFERISEVGQITAETISELRDSVINVSDAANLLEQHEPSENQYLIEAIPSALPRWQSIDQATRNREAEGWSLESIGDAMPNPLATLVIFRRRLSTEVEANGNEKVIFKEFSSSELSE